MLLVVTEFDGLDYMDPEVMVAALLAVYDEAVEGEEVVLPSLVYNSRAGDVYEP